MNRHTPRITTTINFSLEGDSLPCQFFVVTLIISSLCFKIEKMFLIWQLMSKGSAQNYLICTQIAVNILLNNCNVYKIQNLFIQSLSFFLIVMLWLALSIVGSLRDREVACSASYRQGSNFGILCLEGSAISLSHHPQEVLLAQFSLYVHKSGLKTDSFHFLVSTVRQLLHIIGSTRCDCFRHENIKSISVT